MVILIDTREREFKHIVDKLDKLNIPYRKQKLNFGDYSFEIDGKSFENEIVIERKGSVSEIVGNFTKGKRRFENEFKRAKGTKLILMIEGSEDDIEQHKYKSSLTPFKVKSFIKTWTYFFGLDLQFVDRVNSAEFMIKTFENYLTKDTAK